MIMFRFLLTVSFNDSISSNDADDDDAVVKTAIVVINVHVF